MRVRNYIRGIGNAIMGRPSVSRAAKTYRYHAGDNTTSRDNVTPDPRSEDNFWNDDYEVTTTRARTQLRNFAPLAWMIDKHLDFVAAFRVQFDTGFATPGDKRSQPGAQKRGFRCSRFFSWLDGQQFNLLRDFRNKTLRDFRYAE